MKLFSRLMMVFWRSLCEKRQIWVSEPHIGEVRGDAQPWLMARWKAHGRLLSPSLCFFPYILRHRS